RRQRRVPHRRREGHALLASARRRRRRREARLRLRLPQRMSVPTPASPAPVGRLAPSPTGLLHLGHARTFLCAWWSARSRGGRVLMRLEDLDGPRVSPRFSDAALRDRDWLGLDWDGT